MGDNSQKATILVFVALPEEHDRLLELIPPNEAISDSEHVFVEHEVDADGFRVVSVLSRGMGNDDAFDATAAGIKKFNPNMVVCIGIAGSLTDDLKIGDVCISNEIVDISQNMKVTEEKSYQTLRSGKGGGQGNVYLRQ